MPSRDEALRQSYDEFPHVEEAFLAALDESLRPRSSAILYDYVDRLQLPASATILDLGCGGGNHSISLARRFGRGVVGVDPVARNIADARAALAAAARDEPRLAGLVRFEDGTAERIPLDDASADLAWCREMLYFADPLEDALAEVRRVLRPGGHLLVYHHFATSRLEPREATRLWEPLFTRPENADPQHVEGALSRAGFTIIAKDDYGSEFGEYFEETQGVASRRLRHYARLLRAPARYIERFGQGNYDVMLADCMWHIYRMIGKLSSRVYLARSDR